MRRQRFAVIACEVFRQELESLADKLPHEYRFDFQSFGLHDTPEKLAAHLQQIVDATEDVDAILLGYALCSRGIVGVTAREVPIVVPRAHDCMTYFLGSRERYQREFSAHPGTYYYSAGWVEHFNPNKGQAQFGPDAAQKEAARAAKYAAYAAKYGEENAAYLIEMESQWQRHYTRTAFIDTGVGDRERYRRFVRRLAEERGWNYDEIEGSTALMARFLAGDWDEDFLIVPPHHRIRDDINEDIIRAESVKPSAEE